MPEPTATQSPRKGKIMTGKHRRAFLSALSGVLLLALGMSPSRAEPTAIAAFVGTFTGIGVAESYDDIYAPETVRDLDVVIAARGPDFSVTWTTVVRSVGGKAKRKTRTLSFASTGVGSQYRNDVLDDPFGDGLAWAGIEEQTLSVFVLNIDAKGGYQLQRYARTLTGLGMDLAFTRKVDGEDLRVVKAKLVRSR
jgi:hypothetical protein